MKTFKPFALSILTRPIEFQRRFFLSVATMSFCPMGEKPGLLGEIAMWKFLPTVLPAGTAVDIGLPKTAAEFLVTGSAFAPGGRPVQTITTAVRLGAVTKRVAAVGDRHIEDGVPTAPLPFTEMPMGWDRAYGGPEFKLNPLGRGIAEVPIPGVGFRVALPNVVLPQGAPRPSSPEPVNYGAIDLGWPQRQRLAGTYDDAWLRDDFPGFARDTDWRIFMAAAPDQRFPGFLRGDEDYAIANMHPTRAELTGRLPGIQPRILVRRRGAARLEDVPLSLTTVWFFPAHERLVMIHHGRLRVDEEDARDIVQLVEGCDMLGAPRPAHDFEKVVAARLEPDLGLLEALRDSALVAPELLIPDPDMQAEREMNEEQGLQRKRGHARAIKEHAKERERLAALGLDPDKYMPPPPEPEKPLPTIEELPATIERMKVEVEKAKVETKTFQAARDAELTSAIAAAGLPPSASTPTHRGPPAFSAAVKRTEFQALVAQMIAEGQDPAIPRGMLADPAIQQQWTEAEEKGRQGYLETADGQDPALPLDAAANAAVRARLMDGQRGGARLDLCGADLSGLDLSGFDLTEAWLDGADLTGANLSRAKLQRAVLAHARLEGARLMGAELEGANLGRAALRGADLSHAMLREANLREADLTGARLAKADLTEAQFSGTRLEGADLSEAVAPHMFVNDAVLTGLRAPGAMLESAVFVKVDLSGADFSGAMLAHASFIGVQAEGAVFEGADLSAAVFVDGCKLGRARFAGARAKGANMRGSVLPGAVFDGAVLDGADLSECDLREASLHMVLGREARFVVADLRGARITRSDLAGVSLSRADIRGTDLTETSLYAGDFARVHADTATRLDGVMRAKLRLNPRRSPT